MPKDTIHIAYILDRSGSMQPLTEAAIAGFNQFLREQQQEEGDDARLTLILFDDQYEVTFDLLPIAEIVEIDTDTYTARGSTALLDAIGKTMDHFEKRSRELSEEQRPAKVIFAIFTDGQENASHDHTWKDISKRIRDRREKDGWEFLFLGANQDAIATAAQLSIGRDMASNVAASAKGTFSSSAASSRKIRAYRKELRGLFSPDIAKSLEDLVGEEQSKPDSDKP